VIQGASQQNVLVCCCYHVITVAFWDGPYMHNWIAQKQCISSLIQHQLFPFRHNLSVNKKFGHHSRTTGYACVNFCISTIFAFWGSACSSCSCYAYFWCFFLQILPYFKNFLQKSSQHIILVLGIVNVPNLTFLGLLRPQISFWEITVTQTSNPAYFTIREPQCSALKNIYSQIH